MQTECRGYGFAMTEACRVPAGEPCPACQQADLEPYGNGSKWICPKCYFLLPCCEGGEQPRR